MLTKPDLVGPGNEDEVLAVLRNVRKPLKLGYVIVKCRSQSDINNGLDNKAALAGEQKVPELPANACKVRAIPRSNRTSMLALQSSLFLLAAVLQRAQRIL